MTHTALCRCGHASGDHARNRGECLEEACACEQFWKPSSSPHPTHPHAGRPRKYPEPKIGDRFGDWSVVAILGRGYRGRSDLRLELKCDGCGHRTQTHEYNARQLGKCRARA